MLSPACPKENQRLWEKDSFNNLTYIFGLPKPDVSQYLIRDMKIYLLIIPFIRHLGLEIFIYIYFKLNTC